MAPPTSAEDVFAMGDAQAEGFPIRYASPGFEKLFGYRGPEVAWQKCGDVVGGAGILRDTNLLFAAAAATHRALDQVQERLHFLGERCAEACRVMMAGPGEHVGAALLLNRKENGEFFVCELLLLNLQHPTIGWSYCLGFQRDVSCDVSVEALLANCSDGAYARLMQSRSDAVAARREFILGAGSEKFVQELHLKAMSVFSLDLWRTLRSELMATAPGAGAEGDEEADQKPLSLVMPSLPPPEKRTPPPEEPFSLSLRPGTQAQAAPAPEEPFSLSLSRQPPAPPRPQPAAPAPAAHRPAPPAAGAAPPSRASSGGGAAAPPSRTSSGGAGPLPLRTISGSTSVGGDLADKPRMAQRAPGPALPQPSDGFSRRSTASTVRTLSPAGPSDVCGMEREAETSSEAGKFPTAISRSWELVQAIGVEDVGESMLRNFFELSPEVEDILTDPQVCAKYWDWDWSSNERAEPRACVLPGLRKLSAKILNIVGCAVSGQHDVQKLMPTLVQLGMRHAAYGAREEHFAVLGRALMAALREQLGEEIFTAEVEHAWEVVYSFVSASLQGGMLAGRASAPRQQPQPQQANRKAFSLPAAPGAGAAGRNTLLQHLHGA